MSLRGGHNIQEMELKGQTQRHDSMTGYKLKFGRLALSFRFPEVKTRIQEPVVRYSQPLAANPRSPCHLA